MQKHTPVVKVLEEKNGLSGNWIGQVLVMELEWGTLSAMVEVMEPQWGGQVKVYGQAETVGCFRQTCDVVNDMCVALWGRVPEGYSAGCAQSPQVSWGCWMRGNCWGMMFHLQVPSHR